MKDFFDTNVYVAEALFGGNAILTQDATVRIHWQMSPVATYRKNRAGARQKVWISYAAWFSDSRSSPTSPLTNSR